MFNSHQSHGGGSSPLKTLLGVMGIAVGILFFLQVFEMLPFSFDMTDTTFLKIFGVYAIISGAVLMFSAQGHGSRY
jgi:hypothetical protein